MGGRRRRVATYHRLIAAIGVGNQGTRAPVASRPKRRLAQGRCSCPWVRRSSALPSTPIPPLATLDLAQLFQDGAAAHGLDRPQLLHLLGTWSALALLPQVDGGTAHANQAPVAGRRQAQLGAVGGQARCAEPVLVLSHGLFLGAGGALAVRLLEPLLQCRQLAPQFGVGTSML